MDTVAPGELTQQEQINLLNKRLEAIEKQLALLSKAPARKKAPAKKQPPLTFAEERQAELQIMPILANLPDSKMVSARYISQQKAILRRLGTTKIRAYLDKFVSILFKKEGTGPSALYCIDRD